MAGFDTTTPTYPQAFRDGARAAIDAIETLQNGAMVTHLRYEDFATPEDFVQAGYAHRRAVIARIVDGFGPKTDMERGCLTAFVEMALGSPVECVMSDEEWAAECAPFIADVKDDMAMEKRNANVIRFPKRVA